MKYFNTIKDWYLSLSRFQNSVVWFVLGAIVTAIIAGV